jgi:hypothetical protein
MDSNPRWLAVIADHLEAAQHPARLLAAAAKLPAAADAVAPRHGHCLTAAWHGSAGDNRVRSLPVDFVDAAVVRQPERHQLADAVVCDVPASLCL